MWANFQRIIEHFTQKIVTKLSKVWVWDPGSRIRDPGSGKNLFRIPDPDPGVKKAPDPGSGSATLVCFKIFAQIRIQKFDLMQKIHVATSIRFRANIRLRYSHTGEYLLQNIRIEANIRKTLC